MVFVLAMMLIVKHVILKMVKVVQFAMTVITKARVVALHAPQHVQLAQVQINV